MQPAAQGTIRGTMQPVCARVMKLVDIPDLKSGAERRTGSIPVPGTNTLRIVQRTVLAITASP